jgi:hypothetical protein
MYSHQLDSAGKAEQPNGQSLDSTFVSQPDASNLLAISDIMQPKTSCCGAERQWINASPEVAAWLSKPKKAA